jgi:hypothetical protein
MLYVDTLVGLSIRYTTTVHFDASISNYSLAHTVLTMDYGEGKNNMGNKIVPSILVFSVPY